MSLICLTLMITYQNAMLHALFGRNGSFDMFNSMDYTTLCLGLPNTGGPHSIASGNIAAFFEWCLLISNSGVCILHMHVDIKKALGEGHNNSATTMDSRRLRDDCEA